MHASPFTFYVLPERRRDPNPRPVHTEAWSRRLDPSPHVTRRWCSALHTLRQDGQSNAPIFMLSSTAAFHASNDFDFNACAASLVPISHDLIRSLVISRPLRRV